MQTLVSLAVRSMTCAWVTAGCVACGVLWAEEAGPAKVPHATDRPPLEARPPSEQSRQEIKRLIDQLGDNDYFVRQRAQSQLEKYSFDAFEALNAATAHEDLEIAARARYLLQKMRVGWTSEKDPPEVRVLLQDYEIQELPAKLARMNSLAALPQGKGISALCRLVRYEKSQVLSKRAAIGLISRQPQDSPPSKGIVEQLRANLAGSHRPAAVWLLTWSRWGEDAQAAVAEWAKLVDAEHELLRTSPNQTNAQIVTELVRVQVRWLKTLQQKDQAMVAMRRLIDLEKGRPDTLGELLDWLIEQKAWKEIDALAGRFAPQFAGDARLLYGLAQAQAEQGNKTRAEETAARARQLNPGRDAARLDRHRVIARLLQSRGLFDWAEKEYRQVLAAGTPGDAVVVMAQLSLAEMLHDQGKDLEAGKVLEATADVLEKKANGNILEGLMAPRARANYFFACHWKSLNDLRQQRQCLDKAIEIDPPDVDALIACYRLPEQPPEYQEKIRRLIKESAAKLREDITDDPEDSKAYNEFAWLIGNTEGNMDEALEYSKKSLELTEENGGYYDTLAHVYFGKGDYENAVKAQAKAAQLEPHSGLIAKELERFRKKWEEKKGKP